ncbi:MAG: hypothetical protein ACI4O7_14810 [Aristaeellaceae bacterium]
MRYPPRPEQDPMEPVQRYPMPGQQPMQQGPAQQPYPQGAQPVDPQHSQPMAPMQQPYGQPMQPYPQNVQPMEQPYGQPMQPYPQGAQPMEQPYGQPMQPYPQNAQPMEQPYGQPMQPYPQGAQPMDPQQSQPLQPLQPAPEGMTAPAPDSRARRAAGLYIRDTWIMLAAVLAVLVVIFIIVRMATRGYLWGLIFVLIAAVAAEFPALKLWITSLGDLSGGQLLVQTATLADIAEVTPGLLSRLGISARARYRLTDDQGRSYYFTAEKGLAASFSDLEGAEAELACLPHSRLLTGLNPIRRTEQLSVMDSARERHIRQIFHDYLP